MEHKHYHSVRDGKVEHPMDISDEDILQAMKEIKGYLDITPNDFKDVYQRAYHHALDRFMHGIKAKDIMTRRVISIKGDTPAEKIPELLARHGISGVPVVDDENQVLGVVSGKDFLALLGEDAPRSLMGVLAQCLRQEECLVLPLHKSTAAAIMTAPAITVQADASLCEISVLFAEKKINRVPVVDQQGKLEGIVSRADVIAALYPPKI